MIHELDPRLLYRHSLLILGQRYRECATVPIVHPSSDTYHYHRGSLYFVPSYYPSRRRPCYSLPEDLLHRTLTPRLIVPCSVFVLNLSHKVFPICGTPPSTQTPMGRTLISGTFPPTYVFSPLVTSLASTSRRVPPPRTNKKKRRVLRETVKRVRRKEDISAGRWGNKSARLRSRGPQTKWVLLWLHSLLHRRLGLL